MTKKEIIAAYEKATKKKAFMTLGNDKYIYTLYDGSRFIKTHPYNEQDGKIEIFSIGRYAIAFSKHMVDIKCIDSLGNEHNIYYGIYNSWKTKGR